MFTILACVFALYSLLQASVPTRLSTADRLGLSQRGVLERVVVGYRVGGIYVAGLDRTGRHSRGRYVQDRACEYQHVKNRILGRVTYLIISFFLLKP